MCLFHLQIAKRATVFAATPTEVVLRSTNLSVLRHRSTTLVALLSVMLLAGCADRELYKSVQGHTVRDLDVSPDGQHLLIAVSATPKDNYAVPLDQWSVRLCEFETGKELKRIDRAAQ